MLEVPVVVLDPDLPLPRYARPGDAGFDLVARERAELAPGGGRVLVPTGIAVALPEGFAGFVQPRSGLALEHGVTVLNSPGLVDAGYRGELKVVLVNTDPVQPVHGRAGRPHRPVRRAGGRARAADRGRRASTRASEARAASGTPA